MPPGGVERSFGLLGSGPPFRRAWGGARVRTTKAASWLIPAELRCTAPEAEHGPPASCKRKQDLRGSHDGSGTSHGESGRNWR